MMPRSLSRSSRSLYLFIPFVSSFLLLAVALFGLQSRVPTAYADPIDPPEGYPKLSLSSKTVSPTLAATGGETLYYTIEIRNTGAYAAEETILLDPIPANTTYNDDATSSVPGTFDFSANVLEWQGEVPFDTTVVISFSVDVDAAFSGTIENSATITDPLIAEPVTVTAATVVTDEPLLAIGKGSEPAKPGANLPLTYTLVVTNLGQPATNLSITVSDEIPDDTSYLSAGPDASFSAGVVTWNRAVTLDLGDTTSFTFAVTVDDVLSGTILTNDNYEVSSALTGVATGSVYTTTVIDPILTIDKEVWPDPPGSNRELTYTITILNKGSLATDLEVTDVVPDGVEYVDGGDSYDEQSGEVIWTVARLDSDESVELSYVVYAGDVADLQVINSDYEVCAGTICATGDPLTSTVGSATFAATAKVDPIAKKPGDNVTPTLTIENLGPGNALDATALLLFERISPSATALVFTPAQGTVEPADCGEKCKAFLWTGDLAYGQIITFTFDDAQNSVGGEEGTSYTATIIISDSVGLTHTMPVSAFAVGKVTHHANLVPYKSAPDVIGRGQLLTYTIRVWNSGLSTDTPPFPILTDTLPLSTTFVSASDGGEAQTAGDATVVSWTLPALSTNEEVIRTFTVRADDDIVSGTKLVNDDYGTSWYELDVTGVFSYTGEPVTTTVQEIGLIDSYKEVTPTLARPGEGIVLTYHVHIVNSSPVPLQDVELYDYLPWQSTTYQRDAEVSAGTLVSDIVSLSWTGDVDAYSEETITLTVVVDPGFEGAITNTAVISHPDLLEAVTIDAVAYITNDPVLEITKSATPEPVKAGNELLYTIAVINRGQQATGLVITDTIPENGTYVAGSASGNGKLVGDQVRWQIPVLESLDSRTFTFRVEVGGGQHIVNAFYGVTSGEGISAVGLPVTTTIRGGAMYLPVILKY